MDSYPTSSPRAVPSIRIYDADDTSALFDDRALLPPEMFSFVSGDPYLHACSQDSQSEYPASNFFPSFPPELDDIAELSHLSTTGQYLTGHTYSLPHSTILQESGATTSADGGSLLPSSLSSPVPSPTSSFTSSLSPSSLYDHMFISDSESPTSPSPATPDQSFHWPAQFNNQSSDSLVQPFIGSVPNDPISPSGSPGSLTHRRSRSSSSSRREPVASKAMLEANSRRRRHPAQFECPDCRQTFTALFSLKRHMQSHTGERPFECSIPGCTQRFYNSSDCKRHEKSKKRHKDLAMQ